MDPIIFQKLKSTTDGIGASTGKQTEKAFNENFDLVKKLLEDIIRVLSLQVSSSEMKQIKVDTSTSPATVYYSLDDVTVTNPTWIRLLTFGFADLAGSPYDNIALKTILDTKAPQGGLDSLTLQVNACISDITKLQADLPKDVSDLQKDINDKTKAVQDDLNNKYKELKDADADQVKDISDLKTADVALDGKIKTNADDIKDIQDLLPDVVMTTHGDSLWLKYDPAKSQLLMSQDKGTTWGALGALLLEWQQIAGDPSRATSLVTYVNSVITAKLNDYTQKQTFNAHLADYSNPHKVTAAQLGLSTVVQDIVELKDGVNSIKTVNITSYLKHINDIPEAAYFTHSSFSRAKLEIESDNYFNFVKTIGPSETYTGPDGSQITVAKWEAGFDSPYYKINYNTVDSTKIDISWNQTLYDWVQAGGVLD